MLVTFIKFKKKLLIAINNHNVDFNLTNKINYENLLRALPWLIFTILHLPRPFFIGLYHDDWFHFYAPILLSPAELYSFLMEIGGRPLYGLNLWLVYVIWNGDPAYLTMIMSLLVGLTAISLYFFIKKIYFNHSKGTTAALLGTSFWLAIPWGFGYSLWPTACLTLTGIIFFLWSQFNLISFYRGGLKINIIFMSFFLSLAFGTYQAMFFGFIPTILLIFYKNKNIKRLAIIGLICILIQLIFLYITKQSSGKSFDFHITRLISAFLFGLPLTLKSTFYNLWLIPFFLTSLIFIRYIKINFIKNIKYNIYLLITLFISISLSIYIFTLAGYSLTGIGIFSRTTIGVNIWLSVFFGIFLCNSITCNKRTSITTTYTLVFCLLITMVLASINQTINWAKSWKHQIEIIKDLPYSNFINIPMNSVVLIDEPLDINGITIFGASWDISSAIYSQPEMATIRHFKQKPLFTPLGNKKISKVNGKILIEPNEGYISEDVWIYHPKSKTLKKYN
jgi:hypothetical protein